MILDLWTAIPKLDHWVGANFGDVGLQGQDVQVVLEAPRTWMTLLQNSVLEPNILEVHYAAVSKHLSMFKDPDVCEQNKVQLGRNFEFMNKDKQEFFFFCRV